MSDNPEGMCSCNRSRGYDELMQRYEKLESVAKEMSQWINDITHCWWTYYPEKPDYFRRKLLDCGVSIDD